MEKNYNKIIKFSKLIALLVFLYFITRFLFFLFNKSQFDTSNNLETALIFIKALRFDLSSMAITNILFIGLFFLPFEFFYKKGYQILLKYLFIIINTICLGANLVDVAYFPFVKKRSQFDAINFLNGNKGNEFFNLIPSFLKQYAVLVFLFFGIIFLLIFFYKKIMNNNKGIKNEKKSSIVFSILLMFGILFLSVIAIRGGFQIRPLTMINASEMTSVKNIPLLINTPFSIINTIDKKPLQKVNYFSESEMKKEFSGIHFPKHKNLKKMNVVVLIIESLSKKYVGVYGNNTNTPFLDKLISKSLSFPNGFSNANESIQGIPAIVASIPSWSDDPFLFSAYSANRISSMANLLKPFGYESSFFHGASEGSMNFDAFCNLAGFDNYYSRETFNNEQEFDGKWGIWDEPFLQYMVETINKKKSPFLSICFTLNTHHPFVIPNKYKKVIKQKGHPMNTCVRYEDMALQRFFETAQKMTWYKNTLFVITADHTAPLFEEKSNSALAYNQIPILFYLPDESLTKVDSSILNQIDILPTMLDILQYPKPYFCLGKSGISEFKNNCSINYNAGIYNFINADFCIQYNIKNPLGMYVWKKDSFFKKDILKTQNEMFLKCASIYKKYIQLYNNSLIENKMLY
ncbi:MAG: sulfatase-like hydrolase/transferase [Chitinophagaceae bacterium]|nr:sulfatase-like hydrolase/transferase [Chitinophagaceae bacterium]